MKNVIKTMAIIITLTSGTSIFAQGDPYQVNFISDSWNILNYVIKMNGSMCDRIGATVVCEATANDFNNTAFTVSNGKTSCAWMGNSTKGLQDPPGGCPLAGTPVPRWPAIPKDAITVRLK